MSASSSSRIDPAIGHLAALGQSLVDERSDVLSVLGQVADPRKRRGVRHTLPAILGVVVCAVRRRVAVDGKTLRGSGLAGGSGRHLLAALDHVHGVVLGQVDVAAKTNEIPMFTTLLKSPPSPPDWAFRTPRKRSRSSVAGGA